MVTWEMPNATDNSGNVSDIICNPPSASTFTIGQATVTCETEDRSGNRAVCHFHVNVTGTCLSIQISVNHFRLLFIRSAILHR